MLRLAGQASSGDKPPNQRLRAEHMHEARSAVTVCSKRITPTHGTATSSDAPNNHMTCTTLKPSRWPRGGP
eukprot:9358026-Prorocentrum_lima.AAC.1